MDDRFYVYCYWIDYTVPLYFGKGTLGRCYWHLRESRLANPRTRFTRELKRLRALGVEPTLMFEQTGLTHNEAHTLEDSLIERYGRLNIDPGGILFNIAIGQRGWVHTAETKAKIQSSTKACIADGRMKTWATSITPEERAANVTKGNKSRAKPIHEYNTHGLFIKTWACYADVVANGANKAKLSSALKDQRIECAGSLWSHVFVGNLGVTPEDIADRSTWSTKPKNAKAIYQDGHIVWPSVSAAIREFGGHHLLYERAISSGEPLFGSIWSR